MLVYDIEYTFDKEVIHEKIEGALEGEFDEPEQEWDEIEGHIQLGGENFGSVFIEACIMLTEVFGEDNYNIVSINNIKGIDILNWVGEGEPCMCPFCKAKTMADEDLMHFNCPKCKNIIKVADGDWECIECPECKEEIYRDKIIDVGHGKYKVLEIKNLKEK